MKAERFGPASSIVMRDGPALELGATKGRREPQKEKRAISSPFIESLEIKRKVQEEMPLSAGVDAVVATAAKWPS